MQRILLILIIGSVCGSVVFAQGQVQFEPVVDFGDVIKDFQDTMGKILAEYWVILLSVFVVWFLMGCAKAFLDGRFERVSQEVERQQQIDKRVQQIEDKREAERLALQREMEQSGYADEMEREYRSRDLQRHVGNDTNKEIYTDSNGQQFEIVRHEDFVEYRPYQSHYESKAAGSIYQDASGYWLPELVIGKKDDDLFDDELLLQNNDEDSHREYYIDDEGKPKEKDKRTGRSRDRISWDKEEGDYGGY